MSASGYICFVNVLIMLVYAESKSHYVFKTGME